MRSIVVMAMVLLTGIVASAQEKYPLTKEGNKYVCMGEETCRLDDKSTFGSIVLWALDHDNATEGKPMNIDAKQLTLTMNAIVADAKEPDKTYTFQLAMGVRNGKIDFLISEAKYVPKGVLAVLKTVVLDKLNLDKKPQNKEYVDRFAVLCSQYMQQAYADILASNLKIAHWDNIVTGQVVNGMTPDEVKLTLGKPLSITENPQRTMWNYASGTIVMIENGKVSGVLK